MAMESQSTASSDPALQPFQVTQGHGAGQSRITGEQQPRSPRPAQLHTTPPPHPALYRRGKLRHVVCPVLCSRGLSSPLLGRDPQQLKGRCPQHSPIPFQLCLGRASEPSAPHRIRIMPSTWARQVEDALAHLSPHRGAGMGCRMLCSCSVPEQTQGCKGRGAGCSVLAWLLSPHKDAGMGCVDALFSLGSCLSAGHGKLSPEQAGASYRG